MEVFGSWDGGGPVGATYQGSLSISGSGADPTLSGLPFGPERSDRVLVAAINWIGNYNQGISISSATIGGVPASILNQWHHSDPLLEAIGSAIVAAIVPTGTSGSVVVHFNDIVSTCRVGIYNLTNVLSLSVVDHAQNNIQASSGSSPSNIDLSLVVPANGIAIGCAAQWRNALGGTQSWTGMTPGEIVDAAFHFGNAFYLNSTDTSVSRSASASCTVGGCDAAACSVSLR